MAYSLTEITTNYQRFYFKIEAGAYVITNAIEHPK